MKTLDIIRRISGTLAAMVMLAGCGEPTTHPASIESVAQTGAMAMQRHHVRSWMAPDVRKNDLIYASDEVSVYVLSLRDGKMVGELDVENQANALCSDEAGNVFIPLTPASGEPEVLEYAHGGTSPIATYSDPYGGPFGCSVDPKTGNLAVTNADTVSKTSSGEPSIGPGNVVIYQNAGSMPTVYTAPGFGDYLYCTFDGQGDLFIDGNKAFAEMSYGSNKFTAFSVDKTVRQPAALQWDGSYVTLEDANNSSIYRLRVSGSIATTVQTIRLNRWNDPHEKPQSWIQGKRVVAPGGHGSGRIRLWRYPGGKLLWRAKKIGVNGFSGITISVAPRNQP